MFVHIFQKDKYEFLVGIFTAKPFIVSKILFTQYIQEDYKIISFDESVSKYIYVLKNVENFFVGA